MTAMTRATARLIESLGVEPQDIVIDGNMTPHGRADGWRWRPAVVQNLAVGQVRGGDLQGALKRVRLALRRKPEAAHLRNFKAELEKAIEAEAASELATAPR